MIIRIYIFSASESFKGFSSRAAGKRAAERDVMNTNLIKEIEAEQMKAEVPEFVVGDTVRVHNRIKEGEKVRTQVFEGTVIKKQGGSNRATFTVRKLSNGVGVEKTWPIHSPNVERVDVVRSGKARRAKLFFLRQRIGKRSKLKEILK